MVDKATVIENKIMEMEKDEKRKPPFPGQPEEAKRLGSTGIVKMILCISRLLVRCTLYIMRYGNRIQNESHDFHGVCQSSGFEGKTHRVGLEPLRATKARDEMTQRVASSWHTRCPIEGT
jgi:hypothetical protein